MQDPHLIRTALRRRIKTQRRQLTSSERIQRSKRIAAALRGAGIGHAGQRIALYSPMGGEVLLDDVVRRLRELKCELFLPRIVSWRSRRMRFVRWDVDTRLRRHRFGMLEPVNGATTPAIKLDLVLVPAVAIDDSGMRLGMGGGFYDRSFAHRRRALWRRPRLIALVYDFQRVAEIPHQSLDVPVDAVVSESGVRWFGRRKELQ